MKKFYLTLVTSLSLTSFLIAQSGSLDISFGSGGYSTYPSPNGSSDFKESIIQPDGKIVTVGFFTGPNDKDFMVARYNTDGTLDQSFGTGGTSIHSLNGLDAFWSVALQGDGKIVAAGLTYNGTADQIAVARYNTDGSFDNGFGTNGISVLNLNGLSDRPWSVQVQQDGKIVIGGITRISFTNDDHFIARLTATGTLDPSFNGGSGYISRDYGDAESVQNIAIQPDGKIVFVGLSESAGSASGFISRLNTDGTSDFSFANTGTVTYTDPNGNDAAFTSVVLRPDGRIIGGGAVGQVGTADGLLLQLNNTNYLPDNSFGTNGVVSFDINGQDDYISSMFLQSDGKLVTAGASYIGTTFGDNIVARFSTDGTLDPAFSINGVASLDLATWDEFPHDCVIDQMGRIVISGGFEAADYTAYVARMNSEAVGVEEISSTSSFSAYPSAFTEGFTLRYADLAVNPQLSLFDMTGREIDIHASTQLYGTGETYLHLPDIGSGKYILQISEGGVKHHLAIVKH